ncbi:MAG TPA: hypothetical protein VIR33_01175, partial [Thermopolyspora sp.]
RGEDRLAGRVGRVIAAGAGDLGPWLRAEGVRYALIATPNENTFRSRLPQAVPVFAGQHLVLLRL